MLAKFKNLEEFEHYFNQLIIDEEYNADSQPPRRKVRLPERWKNPVALRDVEKRIYNDLQKLKELDSFDPHISDELMTKSENNRDQLLQRFKWNECIL